MVGFLFGSNTGETPDSLNRKRRLIEEMLLGRQTPTTTAGGIGSIIGALGQGIGMNRLDAIEAEKTQAAMDTFSKSSLGGGMGLASYQPPPKGLADYRPEPVRTGAAAATATSGGRVAPAFANDGTELGGYLSDPARRATLPAGMRNNNPGNLKFVGQKIAGIVGPSVNTDQGDPQAVFATPEAGMNAMFQLAKRKYDGGKLTADQLIAGNMGWTPGNHQAAANVARNMGIGPNDDIRLNDPAMATKFMRGLILQEHGKSGALYPESMIASAIGGQPVQLASAEPKTATDAIDAVAPQAYVDPRVVKVPPSNPVTSGQPMQVAQAQQPQGFNNPYAGADAETLKLLANPWLPKELRAAITMRLQGQMEEQSWRARQDYLHQQEQADPAHQLDMRYKQAQIDALTRKGGTDDESFYGNPIAIQTPDGIKYGQIGNKGGFKEIKIGDGNRFAPNTRTVDTGTELVTVGPGGEILERIPKQNRQEAADKAAGTVEGKTNAEAQLALGSTLQKADTSISLIDAMINHPGRETATGWSSWYDPRNVLPGTDATDFNVRRKQLEGRAFLEAFESLKGGGQITEIEGKKATEAIARLSTAQSDDAYKAALMELREIIEVGKQRAMQKAGIAVPTTTPAISDLPAKPNGGQADEAWTEIAPGVRVRKVQ